MYIPFVLFTEALLQAIKDAGVKYLIIQRFSWPGLNRSTTFLVTPYAAMDSAKEHELQLREKEGKLLDINFEYGKVLQLLNDGRGLRFYLNKFKENNWNKRMLQVYQRNITGYLSSRTNFTRQDTIDINFVLKYGHLIAEVRAKDKSLDVPAIDLIK
ncbi:hypothetical protein D3C87_130290 [compost metagenome]